MLYDYAYDFFHTMSCKENLRQVNCNIAFMSVLEVSRFEDYLLRRIPFTD